MRERPFRTCVQLSCLQSSLKILTQGFTPFLKCMVGLACCARSKATPDAAAPEAACNTQCVANNSETCGGILRMEVMPASKGQSKSTIPPENLLSQTLMDCFVLIRRMGRSNPSGAFRCCSLLPSPSADARSSDDVLPHWKAHTRHSLHRPHHHHHRRHTLCRHRRSRRGRRWTDG